MKWYILCTRLTHDTELTVVTGNEDDSIPNQLTAMLRGANWLGKMMLFFLILGAISLTMSSMYA